MSVLAFSAEGVAECARRIREPVHLISGVLSGDDDIGLTVGEVKPGNVVVGTLPPLYPEWLGDRSFCTAHGTRYPYAAGEMGHGVATTSMVIALARAELLGFFGSAGLPLSTVERAVAGLAASVGGRPNWGVNLAADPATENAVVDLLLAHGVPCVSVSGFRELTPAVVRCSAVGLIRDPEGRIQRRTNIFAKVNSPELAERFLSPAPQRMLRDLIHSGQITAEEAELAALVPVAEDITASSGSARPLMSLLPAILALRDELAARFGYTRPVRVGAAGGLGTPQSVAAAFTLGADYVVTGSVNQAAVESGLSAAGKRLLSAADLADTCLAPRSDGFERGEQAQVLCKGTRFAERASRLHQLYRDHQSLEEIPPAELAVLERDILRRPVSEVLAELPAAGDARQRMAQVFRWYLDRSVLWAVHGDPARAADYQLRCGPAMGAFNRWTAGTFLADQENRSVVQIALNLLEGAAVVTRAQQLRGYGVPVPTSSFAFPPRELP
ncbi:PfaD family polyunsaturated fatty acid/polyketide biosynthesis protein [Allokutzneria albata]|uniref:PfaD family protein n=1 Tax=Allokutzneria albata TaxID=211114 RepID=A0A1G9SYS6_ALLAB|nr:PfaD family polyunsaturated fatty acid/polyketide biosynthesis protein [Allokutzneria albata]SDM40588.1 PfaD family protein [Allokutzneria albata]